MLLSNLNLLATAPGGVARLRELILTLAVQGKLISNSSVLEWHQTTLGEIGSWGSGGTPPKTHAEYYEGGTIPWLVIGDLNDGVVTEAQTKITEQGLANSSAKLISPDTLLIAMYGSIGKLGISGISCATNQAIAFCKPDLTQISVLYLYLYLRAIRKELLKQGQGLAQQNISQKVLRQVEISLPTLEEQSRIVTRVEELMRLCDALEAKGQLEATQHAQLVSTLLTTLTDSETPAQLMESWHRIATHFDLLLDRPEAVDALEQTILQLAVRGLLVPQDPQDEPAIELMKKISAERTKLIAEGKIKRDKPLPAMATNDQPFALPQGWEWTRMQEAFDVRDGTHDTPKYVERDGVPLITSRNFDAGRICFDGAKLISRTDHELIKRRSRVERGDILYSMIGGNIGNQVLVDTDREFSIKNVALFKYVSRSHTLPLYLNLFLETVTLGLQGRAVGGAQPFVSLSLLRSIPFSLPPVAEQSRIVTRVAQLRSLCADLRQRLTASQSTQAQLAEALIQEVA